MHHSSNIHPQYPTTHTWGHTPNEIDSSKTFRIVVQNPKGLRIQQSIANLSLGNRICHSLGTGLIALTETNVNWSQPYQLTRVQQTLQDQWETTATQSSQHPETHRSEHQRGGTLQILTDRWVSRLQKKGVDPYGLGQWSYMILDGKGNKSIAIITAYRPCNDSPSSAGDKTVYMQQFCTLLQHHNSIKNPATPNPDRQFTMDLQAWVSMLQASGHSIILCLDSSEQILSQDGKYEPLEYSNGTFISSHTHSGKMSCLVTTCGLVDSLALFHPPPFPSTYTYSKNRLDYIFISQDIAHSSLHSGVLPLYSIFHSDHNAIYLDLDSSTLFGEATTLIATPRRRGLKLKDPRKIEAYLANLTKQFTYHKVVDKLSRLDQCLLDKAWTADCNIEYEKLDSIITEAM
jgi:exonuclease III